MKVNLAEGAPHFHRYRSDGADMMYGYPRCYLANRGADSGWVLRPDVDYGEQRVMVKSDRAGAMSTGRSGSSHFLEPGGYLPVHPGAPLTW